jgi:PAS domain S-box-containing protein
MSFPLDAERRPVNRTTESPLKRTQRASKSLSRRTIRLSLVSRYGAAVALAVVAILIRLALDPIWGLRLPYITLFPAIMVSAWIGGAGPGILTTVLTAVAAEYFWIEPTGSWLVEDKTELVGLGLFVVIGIFIGVLNEAWRRGIDAVGASEERLRVTINSLGDAVVATDEQGRVTQLNPAAEALTGWPQNEAVGRRLAEVLVMVNEETRRPAENPVERVLREGTIAGLANHTVLISRNGREVPIDDSAAPVRTEDGRIVGAVMVFRDITERRQIERERAERQRVSQELAAIVASSADAILGMDLSGTITAWNEAAERMYGYRASEAIGQSIHVIVPEDRLREEKEVLDRIHVGDRVEHFETVRQRKDGTTFSVSLTISPVRNAAGAVIGASKIARDITDQKRADERFRLAVEAAPAAMILVDQAGMIVMINTLAEQVLGYSREEIVRQPIERLVPSRYRHQHANFRAGFFSDARQRPMGAGRELYALRRDGSEVPVEIGLSPIESSEGRFVLAAVTDISERKRVEQDIEERRAQLLSREQEARAELERASRMKDEFVAVLSHELRTPLNAVLGYAHLLGSGALSPERARHALDAIQRNAHAQARLVESLLDLSRVMAGKMELDLARLDLSTIIDAAIDVIRPEVDKKGITLAIQVPSGEISLVGDANRLQQVFWNLLSNAVKFTPAGGLIQIHATKRDAQVDVKVIDSGQGIAPEFLPYVFDRFRQEGAGRGKSPSGLGLGLAVVREMVQAHGGTVVAHSDGEGRGSAFTVTLPSTLQVPSRAHVGLGSESTSVGSLSGLNVLVVDDDGDVRELLTLLLESRGATVRAVASTIEALDAVYRKRPDVLLADLRMPDEDGYSLIRQLRTRERQRRLAPIPAIAVTAYASVSDREQAIAAGYDWHLAKPIDPDALSRLVARLANVENV